MRIEITGDAISADALADLSRHLRLPVGFEDGPELAAQLEQLLAAAVRVVEERTRRLLLTRSVKVSFDGWDCDQTLVLPLLPAIAVESVALAGPDGARSAVSPELWRLELLRGRPHLRARSGRRLPGAPVDGHIEVRYLAGYGAAWSETPHDLRQAAVILAASWFDAGGAPGGETPSTVNALVAPYLPVRL